MKVFFAAFFICLTLICVLVNILETQRKKQEELERRIQDLEGRESAE